MERRQRPPANGTCNRPGYGGSSAQQTPRLRPEAPQFLPPRLAPRPGEEPPRALFPGGGHWESRPPYEASEQRPHRGGRGDYTQEGYHQPLPHGGPQGVPQFRPPRPEVLPHGGLRPGMPPPVEPARIQEMGVQPGPPPMQQNPIIAIHHGAPQQDVPDHRRGSQDVGERHSNVQHHNTYHPEGHPIYQPGERQHPGAIYQPGERQHPDAIYQPGERQHPDTIYQPGERQHPDTIYQLGERQHSDSIYQPGERHPNIQHPYTIYHPGKRRPNIQHPDTVYQPGDQHPNVQHHDTIYQPGEQHPNVQHHDTIYQPGEGHPNVQRHDTIYQLGKQYLNVQRHGGPQDPCNLDGPRSERPDAYQPDMFHQDGVSRFRGTDPAFAQYGGHQPDGFQKDLPHNNLHLPYKNEGSQPGLNNVKNPPVPDAFSYRAPSPGILQFSTQLQPVPTQNSSYTDNPNQGHQPLPPMHGNFPNASCALQPQVGLAFSGTLEERDLEVPQLQRPHNHPPHPLEQQSVMHQDRSHGPDLLASSGMAEDRYLKCEAPFFTQHDVPVGLGDPHLLPQHGGPFVQQPAPQREDSFMQTDLENDGPSDKDLFMQWISGFLSCRRKKPPTKLVTVQAPSVAEARGLIYGALRLVSQLDALCQTLESSNKAGEPWTHEYEKADDIRLDLEKRLKELEKPGYIQDVKEKLERVRKKRLRCQRRRQAAEEEAKAEAERSAEKEASIDLWRMQRIREVEEKKRERELKATADGVLGEVRKKQNDVKKMLDVLKALEKLRKLRKEAAGRKGVCPPPSADETFTNHIKRLRTMVHNRSALYDAEEKTLRVILEGEQEEERQRENDKRQRKEKEKILQKQRELDSILFGDTEPLPSLHPLLPFRQYYLQAEHSVVSLVKIRHEWDQFLVPPDHPDGSSIPRGWVVPTLPSNDIWATALKPSD
ncbi:programmed cell death protein 7 [Dendropsophus ebraccatus]|uniref:programmed cell death protein 7 n=1 Tax=Dendropsophus ebraccatus TaxID=150705 RepID=UPI003831ACDA